MIAAMETAIVTSYSEQSNTSVLKSLDENGRINDSSMKKYFSVFTICVRTLLMIHEIN